MAGWWWTIWAVARVATGRRTPTTSGLHRVTGWAGRITLRAVLEQLSYLFTHSKKK